MVLWPEADNAGHGWIVVSSSQDGQASWQVVNAGREPWVDDAWRAQRPGGIKRTMKDESVPRGGQVGGCQSCRPHRRTAGVQVLVDACSFGPLFSINRQPPHRLQGYVWLMEHVVNILLVFESWLGRMWWPIRESILSRCSWMSLSIFLILVCYQNN
jgi:uncharacterized protein YbdZ (MbtH family)